MAGRKIFGRPTIVVGRAERRGMGQTGKSVFGDCNRDDRIESEQREVRQIVSCEPFRGEMGMNESKAAQTPATGA
jgi:hypothetical protein